MSSQNADKDYLDFMNDELNLLTGGNRTNDDFKIKYSHSFAGNSQIPPYKCHTIPILKTITFQTSYTRMIDPNNENVLIEIINEYHTEFNTFNAFIIFG